uniref:Uncharacterized protein ycf18 n=1 Tax=Leptosiphonia brodiei TaxID=2608611 RepID=A0A1Z1MAB7_9FLOR|nr:phycobilisome degradation protein [Leptosiphonia brodiei]ARW62863.1 phycobilisome degradation protein [Leptosiphonia brodiei]
MNELNLEQEFKIILYSKRIQNFNKNQAKKYLIQILKKMMIKDNIIKYFVKNSIN